MYVNLFGQIMPYCVMPIYRNIGIKARGVESKIKLVIIEDGETDNDTRE